jgi:hypothetical protein
LKNGFCEAHASAATHRAREVAHAKRHRRISGAREALHASRRTAREAVQPHARNQNERKVLEDQITICE